MKTTIADVLKKFPSTEKVNLSTWIKRILKMEFGVSFKAVTHGNSIRVRWSEGPSDKEVDVIVSLFEYGHFDGMQDMYVVNQEDNEWIKAFGGIDYVFTSRDDSSARDAIYKSLIECGVAGDDRDFHGARQTTYRILRNTSIPIGKKVVGVKRNGKVGAGFIEDFYEVVFSS